MLYKESYHEVALTSLLNFFCLPLTPIASQTHSPIIMPSTNDPPDHLPMQLDALSPNPTKPYFLTTLLTPSSTDLLPPNTQAIPLDLDLNDESDNPYDIDDFIPLTDTDKARLYTPWKFYIIVKLFGKPIGHQLLKNKLQTLWCSTEPINLIDLGHVFSLSNLSMETTFYMLSTMAHGLFLVILLQYEDGSRSL